MSQGYAVNIEALGKLIGQLESSTERIAEANNKLAGAQAWGMLGNDVLGTESSQFEQDWGYGIERLGGASQGVTERLAAARSRYVALEEEHKALFPPPLITAENSPPPPPRGGPDSDEGPVGGGYTGCIRGILDGGA